MKETSSLQCKTTITLVRNGPHWRAET